MISFANYVDREQTGVKHFILSEYLQRFGMIIGSWASTITYVDCFSGPWKQQSEQFQDTSFCIALQELRKARDVIQQTFGRQLKLRAFFVEKEAEPYEQLRSFAASQTAKGPTSRFRRGTSPWRIVSPTSSASFKQADRRISPSSSSTPRAGPASG